jgi:hypothetical protein
MQDVPLTFVAYGCVAVATGLSMRLSRIAAADVRARWPTAIPGLRKWGRRVALAGQACAVLAAVALFVIFCEIWPQRVAAMRAAANEPAIVRCSDGSDCGAAWVAARRWADLHSWHRIQVATPTSIQSADFDDVSSLQRFEITRQPAASGGYEIVFRGDCDDLFACPVEMGLLRQSFEQALAAPKVHAEPHAQ